MRKATEVGFLIFMIAMTAIILFALVVQAEKCNRRGGVLAIAVWPPVACVELKR